MRTTATERVLDFIVRRPGSSPAQIARSLHTSPPAIRHHLRRLVRDGRLVVAPARSTGARGRPPLSYRPAERLLGDNLRLICDSLLRAWPRDRGSARMPNLVEALTQGLLRRLPPSANESTPAARLASLVAALDSANYHARWEAGAEGPRIILGHCPYSTIIEAHPELCEMDRSALSRRMQSEATQISKVDVRTHTVNQCLFALGRAAAPPASR